MTAREKEVLGEALRLTAKQRARLAAELLASLETDNAEQVEEIEKAWSDEIERRAKRASSGKSVGSNDLVAAIDAVLQRIQKHPARFALVLPRRSGRPGYWRRRARGNLSH